MRYKHKQILLLGQFLAVGLAFFLIYGAIACFLWIAGEVTLAEAIEYLEILAGSESLSFGAIVYKLMRGKMAFSDFKNWFYGVFDGTEDNIHQEIENFDVEGKVIEREKTNLKKLRRR